MFCFVLFFFMFIKVVPFVLLFSYQDLVILIFNTLIFILNWNSSNQIDLSCSFQNSNKSHLVVHYTLIWCYLSNFMHTWSTYYFNTILHVILNLKSNNTLFKSSRSKSNISKQSHLIICMLDCEECWWSTFASAYLHTRWAQRFNLFLKIINN